MPDSLQSRIRVAALTTGRDDPSARFRVRQHIHHLALQGIDVLELVPRIDKHAGIPSQLKHLTTVFPETLVKMSWRGLKLACRLPGLLASRSADLIWLNRELLPGYYSLERYLNKPFVLDIDDAVWQAKPNGLQTMRKLGTDAAAVLAGNNYIADWFSQFRSNQIHIIPTAIDTDRFVPNSSKDNDIRHTPYTVGWTGTSGNLEYLYAIEKPLNAFLRKVDGRLMIIAEHPPSFEVIDPKRIYYRPWSSQTEASMLQEMDVGLMPLPDIEWSKGKCSFKMLQYMSTGIPVVVSPIGMNRDVLGQGNIGFGAHDEADWYDALLSLYETTGLAKSMGDNGRDVVLQHYSNRVVGTQIASIFKNIA